MSKKRKKARLQGRSSRPLQSEVVKQIDVVHVRLIPARTIPKGAIPADLSRQAKNNSYDPPHFYVDQPFRCVDCGKQEVWTAGQQKWYYEVAKGSIYGRAVRCRPCRQKRRREIEQRKSKG
jgi:hypothetical protein